MLSRYSPINYIIVFFIFSIASCSDEEPKSAEKAIISFRFDNEDNSSLDADVVGVISENTKTVTLTLPFGQSKNALIPSIEVSVGATIEPASGTTQNYTSPVAYVVRAEDGSAVSYVVTVDSEPGPSILSIDPASGSFGMEVTIAGSNFSAVAGDNKVRFNGFEAEVLSASINELVVKVPNGASTGAVSLEINGNVVTGPIFKYYDIFILTHEYVVDVKSYPKLWKNGIGTALTDINSFASDIFLANGDVYVAGNVYNGNGYTPGYWKNSVFVPHYDPKVFAQCSGIFVAGNDVYLSGVVNDGIKFTAVYWKNGKRETLPTSALQRSEATSIAVSGGDVYVACFVINDSNPPFSLYWKNGQENPLTNQGVVTDIRVSGNDVHVVGPHKGYRDQFPVVYTKNGVSQTLTSSGIRRGAANSLLLHGTDVYIAGTEMKEDNGNQPAARVWKNGVAADVIEGPQHSSASEICIIDENVIIAGEMRDGDDVVTFYKFNDQLVIVTRGGTTTEVTGMVVK